MGIRQVHNALSESVDSLSSAVPGLEAAASAIDGIVDSGLAQAASTREGSAMHQAIGHLQEAQELLHGLIQQAHRYSALLEGYHQQMSDTAPAAPGDGSRSGSIMPKNNGATYDTPLVAVQQSFLEHTHRMPLDDEAVMTMITAAVDTLGHQASGFMEATITSLDPDSNEAPDNGQTENLAKLGDLINDQEAPNAARWGAVSLLGMLAMTATTEQSSKPVAAGANNNCGRAARQVLEQALNEPLEDSSDYQKLAEALLAHPPVPADEVALELMLHDPLATAQEVPAEAASPGTEAETQPVYGSSISPPTEIPPGNIQIPEKVIKSIHWISIPPDSPLQVREVRQDGQPVAHIVDLTIYNPRLSKLREERETHPLTNNFWDQFGARITRFIDNGFRARTFGNASDKITVPLFYIKSGNNSASVIRAYFTPCGKTAEGIPVLALVAAARTKSNERKILHLLGVDTTSKGFSM